MSKVLIVYGSNYGQTEKISNFIGVELKVLGHSVDIFSSLKIPFSADPIKYDAVMVGASVYRGRFQKSLRKWVKINAPSLSRRPTAFFSVCLGILQKEDVVKQEEIKTVKEFFFWSNWEPKTWTIFAGALSYTKYNWLIKQVMKLISKKAGRDTDSSHDYEFTNWQDVRNFTQEFSSEILKSQPEISPEKML